METTQIDTEELNKYLDAKDQIETLQAAQEEIKRQLIAVRESKDSSEKRVSLSVGDTDVQFVYSRDNQLYLVAVKQLGYISSCRIHMLSSPA